MWRHISLLYRRTPTNEDPQTLPTQVGVLVGVDCISDTAFYIGHRASFFARQSKNSFVRFAKSRGLKIRNRQISLAKIWNVSAS